MTAKQSGILFFYKFIVVRTVGLDSAVVPLTEEGKRQTDARVWGSFFEHKLKPNERDEAHFKLNEYYDMSVPGVYKILAIAHEATKNSGGTRVEFRSNLLTFTIEKGDPPLASRTPWFSLVWCLRRL